MASERNQAIGERLKRRREELGLTQEELAQQISSITVTGNVLSRWERGRNRPSSVYLEELAQIMGVSTGYLLFGTDSQPGVVNSEAAQHLENIAESLAGIRACLGDLVSVLADSPTRGQQLQDAVAGALVQLGGDPSLIRRDDEAQPPAPSKRRARAARKPKAS